MEITNDSIYESISDATATPQGSSTARRMEVPYDPVVDWIISSDANALSNEVHDDLVIGWGSVTGSTTTPPPSSSRTRIPRVPGTVREKHDYHKYYVPKVVSIGPYHFGVPKLQLVEQLKPVFAMRLFLENQETQTRLLEVLGRPEMVHQLRGYYEKDSTTDYSDKDFAKMMFRDSCFILHFIRSIVHGYYEEISELKSHEIFFVRRDLFLLENQIPYIVLSEVMKFVPDGCEVMKFVPDGWSEIIINEFIDHSCFVKRRRPKTKKRRVVGHCGGDEDYEEPPYHLLGVVHGKHSRKSKNSKPKINPFKFQGCNFRKVTELADVGIYFRPIRDTLSMTHIEFVKSKWWFSAYVKLPPIAMNDYTRPMLLNLMAYETCMFTIDESWVTSYVYLLGYLIDDVEDVKLLRKAWVLDNYLVSDKEVVDLFDEIGIDLVENSDEYLEAKFKIQKHYECWRNTLFFQLKNEYFKNPWAYFALLGALIALFFTGVQTYFTVWGPKSTCDDLCMFLKINHHL